jgi:hypothetical protein
MGGVSGAGKIWQLFAHPIPLQQPVDEPLQLHRFPSLLIPLLVRIADELAVEADQLGNVVRAA